MHHAQKLQKNFPVAEGDHAPAPFLKLLPATPKPDTDKLCWFFPGDNRFEAPRRSK